MDSSPGSIEPSKIELKIPVGPWGIARHIDIADRSRVVIQFEKVDFGGLCARIGLETKGFVHYGGRAAFAVQTAHALPQTLGQALEQTLDSWRVHTLGKTLGHLPQQQKAPAIRPNHWRLPWRLLQSTCHTTCHGGAGTRHGGAGTRHGCAGTRHGAHAMQPNHAPKNGVTYLNKWGANPTYT